MVVLIGFAEALAAPEVLWSLVDAGYSVSSFSRRGRRPALRRSRYVDVHEVTPPEEDYRATTDELRSLMTSLTSSDTEQNVLFPLDDSSLWLAQHLALPDGWVLAGPNSAGTELALEKEKQIAAARAAGFDVPESVIVSSKPELQSYADKLPLFLRPVEAVLDCETYLARGANQICSDPAELELAAQKWDGRGRLLVQPYLQGAGQGIFGLVTDEGVVAWSGHQRLRMLNPHGSGASACISQMPAEPLKRAAENFVKAASWRGIFMIELLQERNGKTWFVEFNGRPWGSMALARRQGLEYPAWAVDLALRRPRREIPAGVNGHRIIARNLGRELMHVAFVGRGPRSRAVQNWPPLLRSIWDVMRPYSHASFYNWRRNDWRVFADDCWGTIRDNIWKTKNSVRG